MFGLATASAGVPFSTEAYEGAPVESESVLQHDVGFYNDVWHETLTTPPPLPFSVKAGGGSNPNGN